MRRVNRRGEESRAQWGLERDRREEKTKAREDDNSDKERWLQEMGGMGEMCKSCCRQRQHLPRFLQNMKPVKCSMKEKSPMIKLFGKQ